LASEVILKQKQEAVATLTEKLKNSVAGVLVDYKGISVENDTKLRRELRQAGVEYTVIKNSILRRASENAGLGGLDTYLEGTTALALSEADAVVAAKILSRYAVESRGKFTVKAGFVEGGVLDANGVDALAKLPSREELVAQTLRGFNAPISGFVGVLSATMRGLVIALNQIAEKETA